MKLWKIFSIEREGARGNMRRFFGYQKRDEKINNKIKYKLNHRPPGSKVKCKKARGKENQVKQNLFNM